MKRSITHPFRRGAIAVAFTLLSASALAAGMLPETSVVIINEADGEGSINVKNTDEKPALLYVNITNIPEDTESLVIVTPPVSRVEGTETQLVRFILQGGQPLTTQRLKRVTFEGIPEKSMDGAQKVAFTVTQDLPLVIHPKGLEMSRDPWTLLSWEVVAGKLVVKNKSPYVVRLAEAATTLPQERSITLPRPYILPGEELTVADEFEGATLSHIRIYPATIYGYRVKHYDAPLLK